MTARAGSLVLADGSVFEGEIVGAEPDGGVAGGEVVFNTTLTGYQEVLTDPSYAGQIITFTTPHIGNYGVTAADFESRRPFCRGVVMRDVARRHSNHRAEASLDALLRHYGVSAITGVDTRRLTRRLRDHGAMNGAFGTAPLDQLHRAAAAERGTDGVDLVAQVTVDRPYEVSAGPGAPDRLIVAYDFGLKQSILRDLAGLGNVEVVPAGTPAADVLARRPAGVFLSNGPGDPTMVGGAIDAVRSMLGQVPVFGICLGHQVLSLAIGATTFKLPFGHHGGNHPVRDETTGRVEITSQNHNFCVDPASLGRHAEITHINLNDGTVEGIRLPDQAAFSVQYHPEAGPGPHDAGYLFDRFGQLLGDPPGTRRKVDGILIAPERGVA